MESVDSMNGRTAMEFKLFTQNPAPEKGCTTIEKITFIPLNKKIMTHLNFESMVDKQKEKTYYRHKIDIVY